MITQKFKGDALELKMEAAAQPAFDATSAALDDMLEGAYTCEPFLLMLYDEGRIPFSNRVGREAFVPFIREALSRFNNIGSYDFYVFILKGIFGESTLIWFNEPVAGKLSIQVSPAAALTFDGIVRENSGGAYEYFNLVTSVGEKIEFSALSGIENQYELDQLFAEIIPAGIFPIVDLTVFEVSPFVAEDPSGTFYDMVDHLGNQIVFFEY